MEMIKKDVNKEGRKEDNIKQEISNWYERINVEMKGEKQEKRRLHETKEEEGEGNKEGRKEGLERK